MTTASISRMRRNERRRFAFDIVRLELHKMWRILAQDYMTGVKGERFLFYLHDTWSSLMFGKGINFSI